MNNTNVSFYIAPKLYSIQFATYKGFMMMIQVDLDFNFFQKMSALE
jgi:hypothetical protein